MEPDLTTVRSRWVWPSGPVAAGGREFVRGQGDTAGADQALEQFLGAGGFGRGGLHHAGGVHGGRYLGFGSEIAFRAGGAK